MPSISEGGLGAAISDLLGTPSPAATADAGPGLQLPDYGLGNLQGILGFIKDFESHLQSIAASAQSILEVARQGKGGEPAGEAGAAVMEDAAMSYNPIPPPPPAAQMREIDPAKVYQAAMFALTKMPKDWTVEQTLEMGRANRDLVLTQIAAVMPELYADG